MQIQELTDNSKAILLLCGVFTNRATDKQVKPLSVSEYNKLNLLLKERNLQPSDVLNSSTLDEVLSDSRFKLDSERLKCLMSRGASLAFSIEKWMNKGVWVVTKSDKHFPKKLVVKSGDKCPLILYGAGDIGILKFDGIAVVGSRNIDSEGEAYTREIGVRSAENGFCVVSGGARGVDQLAMTSCLGANGSAIGVLANGLLQASVSGMYRDALMERRLALLTPYNPEARFNVGNAMGRNKHIYGLSDFALVVNSENGKGGTWAGATEELRKENGIEVFVRMEGKVPKGNQELLKINAKAFPKRPWDNNLFKNLSELSEPESKPSKQISMFAEDEVR